MSLIGKSYQISCIWMISSLGANCGILIHQKSKIIIAKKCKNVFAVSICVYKLKNRSIKYFKYNYTYNDIFHIIYSHILINYPSSENAQSLEINIENVAVLI